ncbi:MAG: TraB family protein [Candidatus Nanoarchaeia archaeon]|nr:TraB family protein [Candidatus Nanoarchaeia archaeon]
MLTYKNLTIIGTSHIAVQSIREVGNVIMLQKPDVVALELDADRFLGLMHKKKRKITLKDIMATGVKGFFFNLIAAWAEKKLGKMVGTSPGDEMKTAVKAAAEIKAEVALIDRHISETIKSLFRQITWREKFRFIWDILSSPFAGRKKKMAFDLTKVPDNAFIEKIVRMVKKRYPSVYKALIQERNEIMAKHLYNLMQNKGSVVAVVGAGHEEGIISLLKAMQK